MEDKRAILIAAVCVFISIFLISAYVQVRRHEMTKEFGEEVDVVVAADGIPEYGLIRPEQLKVIKVFKAFRQPTTVSKIEDLLDASGSPIYSAFVTIYKDEQVTLTKLVQQDGKPVLDRQVERKMRALTIQIAPHTGVGRMIRPGNRIDILAVPNYDSSGTTIFEVKTMVQNVLVLATGRTIQNSVPTRVNKEVLGVLEEEMEQRRRKDWGGGSTESLNFTRPDDNYTNVTVQLTPEDAEKILFLSHSFGDQRLYFTLRNGADQEIAKLETTLLDDVLGPDSDYGNSKRRPPPARPPAPPRFYDSVGGQAIPRY